MTKAILSVGAVLAAVVALAGCGGGSGSASGTVSTPAGTTSGVAGVSTSKTSTTVTASSGASTSSSFNVKAHRLSKQIQKSVRQFANGKLGAAAASGAALLSSCKSTVNKQLAPRAVNAMQKNAVKELRRSCADMQNAASRGRSGDMSGAKQWAMKALQQAQAAAKHVD